MARETKIGVALMVLLLGVFGAVAYRKWDTARATANADAAEPVAQAPTGPPTAETKDDLQPRNPFDALEPIKSPAAGAAEPASLFADASSTGGVPARQVSATSTDDWSAEPVAQFEPAAQDVLVAQNEPAGDDPFSDAGTSATDPMNPETSDAGGGFADDAFADAGLTDGAASTEPVSETPTVADDPFGDAAGSAGKSTAQASSPLAGEGGADEAADPAVAETTVEEDPFGGSEAAEPAPPAVAEAGAEPADDAAADLSGDATDDPAGSSAVAERVEEPMSENSDDLFGDSTDPVVAGPAASPAPTEPQAPNETADDPFGEADGAAPATSVSSTSTPSATTESPLTDETAASDIAETSGEPAPVPDEFLPAVERTEVPAADVAASEPRTQVPPEEPTTLPAVTVPPAGRTDYCTVAENDSYWAISQRVYGTSAYFHALAKYNEHRIRDPRKLRPGMKVLTPPPEELKARYPKLVARNAGGSIPSTAERSGFVVTDSGRPAYRVGKGDTLGGIAQSHLGRAARWVQIYELNRARIPDPNTLKPGTILELPSDASRVRIARGQ